MEYPNRFLFLLIALCFNVHQNGKTVLVAQLLLASLLFPKHEFWVMRLSLSLQNNIR